MGVSVMKATRFVLNASSRNGVGGRQAIKNNNT